jgi:hypothetical protein
MFDKGKTKPNHTTTNTTSKGVARILSLATVKPTAHLVVHSASPPEQDTATTTLISQVLSFGTKQSDKALPNFSYKVKTPTEEQNNPSLRSPLKNLNSRYYHPHHPIITDLPCFSLSTVDGLTDHTLTEFRIPTKVINPSVTRVALSSARDYLSVPANECIKVNEEGSLAFTLHSIYDRSNILRTDPSKRSFFIDSCNELMRLSETKYKSQEDDTNNNYPTRQVTIEVESSGATELSLYDTNHRGEGSDYYGACTFDLHLPSNVFVGLIRINVSKLILLAMVEIVYE